MFDPLFWVLHHFVTHYAGQPNQGNKNDGDDDNQASGSNPNPKKVTGLLQRADSLRRARALQKTKTSDQRSAFSSVDSQPKKRRKGGYWLRNIFKPSTSYDPPQSDKIPFPACVGKSEVQSYNQNWEPGQYNAFIKEEDKYFKSEYLFEKILGEGYHRMVCLATRKSDGLTVVYKSIKKSKVNGYALESSPPSRCHLPNPLVLSGEPSIAQCMSSRPPNIFFPCEFAMQRYLSQPGRENPYVPKVIDYITLEDEFILVMEYLGGKWMSLISYMEEKVRLDIEDAREIVKEIVNAMKYLKRRGIVHRDLNGVTWDSSSWLECISDLKTLLLSTSIAHLVVECEQVAGHRIQSGLVPAIQKSRLRLLGRALDPGVENVYTWLRGGVLNGEADLDQRWLDGTVEHKSMGARHDSRALGSTG
ncbi:hypothetical protein BASA50_010881 [Batrachochytrium salamandrivorans]|uniref:Protein kinase domain-containing protein n=1 Tax=Batrachochytrium salamandrivorans TaxID=1357716 RepID=A0ABQ8EX61_9FUNG|nr:hypothetical protein BASA50_010881 [Batrachochytrium salamandrivorans]KAH9264505.1 hypothetical protein BASA83_012038 [Batrachochytrium salamandrivorans]